MRYKEFGKTGKKVSVLGFGGMRFDPKDEETAIRAIQRAAELGINYFDTAPGYCEDTSETFIGHALSTLPKDKQKGLYISTKSHIGADPKADDVRRRIDDQLKKFHREKIEFYNMWCIIDLDQFHKIMAKGGPYEGALKAKKEGLIEHICCSSHASGEEIAEIVKADVFQGITLGYNILNHEFRKEGMEAAAKADCAIVTMNPLGGGMLTRDEDMLSILKEDEADSFIAAALRFNFSHSEITVVLAGMKDTAEVEFNVNVAESIREPDPQVIKLLLKKFESLGEAFCTGCRYCIEHCPEEIQIHLYAGLWDRVRMKLPEDAHRVYNVYLAGEDHWLKGKRASDCSQCGECEQACTQKLPIREYMENIAKFLGEK
ncbi:MAG: aldo/keto reductase [Candidatus Aminicenantes bacterium]|nr:MAG: aldo/keto reductase [Candidatus Aminicenantes bacterium]